MPIHTCEAKRVHLMQKFCIYLSNCNYQSYGRFNLMKRHLFFSLIAVFILSLSGNVCAATYGGVDFPGGIVSFADEVVIYSPAISQVGDPSAPYRVPEKALGAPDFDDNETNGIDYVSLGRGGSIVLRFTNNSLTGSGNSANDLWIFEIGPAVEDTFVDISKDNITWTSVGKVTGGTGE